MGKLLDKNDFFVSPLDDSAFAHTFGNKQNLGPTKLFLKALLDIPEDDYDTLTVDTPNLRRLFDKGKKGIVDLKLTTKSGRIIHIELQVDREDDFRSRMLYYGARLVGEQLQQGDKYGRLNQVISIAICGHDLLEGEESYISRFELRNENGKTFTDLLKVVILELPKIPEDDGRALWPWLRFFKCKDKEELEMLAKKHPEVKEAVQIVKSYSLRQRWRNAKLRRDIAHFDENTRKARIEREMQEAKQREEQALLEAREKGLAEGKAEGLAEGKAEGHAEGHAEGLAENSLAIARRMKAAGRPLAEIAEFTELPLETIEKL